MDRAWVRRTLAVAVAASLPATIASLAMALPAATTKPKRVTLTLTQDPSSITASGTAYRKGRPAANVVVTLTAGLTRTSLTARGTDQTGSDGRYAITVPKKGFATTDPQGPTYVYLRSTTSFAKSAIKRITLETTQGEID